MNLKRLIPEFLKYRTRVFRSFIGDIRYGYPTKEVKLIGVTGTSGKSTTANLIYHMLEDNGFKTGVISTVGAKAGRKVLDTGLHVTTPDPMDFKRILRFMADRGCEYVVVEASSHALAQGRLGNIKFDYAVYTNIKRDHLDWHKTWEHYASSKALLAVNTNPNAPIIVNRDDKEGYEFLRRYLTSIKKGDQLITYSMNEIRGIKEEREGIYFQVSDDYYFLPMIGRYNVENSLAAITLGQLFKIPSKDMAKSLKSFRGIEGRMEIMKSDPYQVVVNFAHNQDSLVKSLKSARELISKNSRIIVVFGSAGLRDVEKRYTMGEAAGKHADVIVITAEDPRTEKLYSINSQIIEGADREGGVLQKRFADSGEYKEYLEKNEPLSNMHTQEKAIYVFDEESVNGRYDAIDFAIRIARPGDFVITEGKGHEQSLCFGTTEYDFTDQDAVKKALKNLDKE